MKDDFSIFSVKTESTKKIGEFVIFLRKIWGVKKNCEKKIFLEGEKKIGG